MPRPWRPRPAGPVMTVSARPQRYLLRSLASTPSKPLIFFLTTLLLVLGGLVPGVAADSRPRNPLRTIARVEDAVLHSPSHRIHALSSFQISLTLHQEDEGRRLPIRLRLTPNHDILADDAAIHHINEDGSISIERINRLDHRVFMGHAFVQTGHSLVEGNINDGHWINAGWASIYIHTDGEHPIFEGAFHLAGDHHHIQTSHNFINTRIAGDPVVKAEDEEYMVVWRDSDVLPDAAMVDVELRRRLRQRGLDAEPIGNETINSMNLLSPACSSDGLLFNQDSLHPVYSGINTDGTSSVDSTGSFKRWLFGRQIDGTGDTGGGSAGVNLASTIGNPSGCPTTRKVALMGIAADCNYYAAFGNRDNTSNNIIMQINSASRVYESTFNITLGIQNLIIQNTSCPSESTTSATPWNAGCSSGLTITDRLNLFSKWRGESANDTNAFWMLLSTCATDSAVGLAWLGQLCVPGSSSDGSNETIAATNVVIRTSTEWQVMAHETGHTFGAVHDCTSTTCADGTVTKQQCCPLSSSECNANGAYIMNPSTGTGITQFSACTLGNICSAMGRNSVRSTCLSANKNVVTITGSECGNGIVEEGEECDCGGTEGCGSNTCCDPTTCKFTTNALCDPSNDECCTSTCQLAGSGVVCRASTGSCDPAETCSGTSATCPEDVTLPDGTSCGSSGAGLACASGQCTSRDLQCKTLMGSLTTSNDTYACSDSGCQLSCASPEFGANTCLSMSQSFLDGTPCQGGGHCSNGDCLDVSVAKEIAHAFRTHLEIVIPVAVVVGILVFLAISSCVVSCIRRHRRRRHLQELARMGMPPPPTAPRKPGFLGLGGKRLSKKPTPGEPTLKYGEALNAATVPPTMMRGANNSRVNMTTPMSNANPNLPPSIGAWRQNGYGGGPGSPPPQPPPQSMPAQPPSAFMQQNPQYAGQQWQPQPYQTPRYA
ncbi:hypothetical protein SBRCBS47491_003044 [Sporothrix bragantina]|uniref:Disintegrin and metalloproteinase domain-containing protein B n=1 Tax=Sporothrix bragantina TaxID=671064 RepID=A0ABP0BBU4_9PEZI